MEKFALNLVTLKNQILFECILQGSAVAQEYKYKKYYTNTNGEPENWYEEFIIDMRSATKVKHNQEFFYVVWLDKDFMENWADRGIIACIFYKDKVYSFDNYYTDCPIFQSILKQF